MTSQPAAQPCAWLCASCKRCHANACPTLWGRQPEVLWGHTSSASAAVQPQPASSLVVDQHSLAVARRHRHGWRA